jgi:hypothetical protein
MITTLQKRWCWPDGRYAYRTITGGRHGGDDRKCHDTSFLSFVEVFEHLLEHESLGKWERVCCRDKIQKTYS